jgi:hypothetical protein
VTGEDASGCGCPRKCDIASIVVGKPGNEAHADVAARNRENEAVVVARVEARDRRRRVRQQMNENA